MSVRLVLIALLSLAVVVPAGAQQTVPQPTAPVRPTFELIPEAYVQLDWRGYPEWTVAPGTGRLQFNTFEVRRLRAGADGRWRQVRFEVTVDPQDFDGTLVRDAYAEIRFGGSRIQAGQFKLPGSREYATAARNTDLLERELGARLRRSAIRRDVHGDAARGSIRRASSRRQQRSSRRSA